MPVVTYGKVLVTGSNGFIAVWIVQTLLEQGFSVRGKHLTKLFEKHGDRFELAIVEDITKVCLHRIYNLVKQLLSDSPLAVRKVHSMRLSKESMR